MRAKATEAPSQADYLSDILTVLENIEEHLGAIRNAVEKDRK